jgi:choline dehydrogenase-like flavoprotein
MTTRRQFLGLFARFGAGTAVMSALPGCATISTPEPKTDHYDLVVIGTGFGGSMTALSIAHRFEALHTSSTPPSGPPPRILLLERGTWWTTPVETVQDKEVAVRKLLLERKQPTQEWSTANDLRGTLDLLERCRRSEERPQGLYDFTTVGKRFFGLKNDGVAVLRASGVGGGSLVYSNITIRPPEAIFQDPAWPGMWGGTDPNERNRLYSLARNAISYSVEWALAKAANPDPQADPPDAMKVNTGLSKIITRSTRITPGWNPQFQIDGTLNPGPLPSSPGELIDRARVFQTAVASLRPDDWGTVDLAINDIPPEGTFVPGRPGKAPRGKNYCERQGRCNIGCLPGARHTLNKQIIRALYGQFDVTKPITQPDIPSPNPNPILKHVGLQLWTLIDVDYVSPRPEGGYRIHYRRRTAANLRDATLGIVTANRVIVAAGSLGTTEIMLRSQQKARATNGAAGLTAVSSRIGERFSTNGDYIAFLAPTANHVNLTRGPVTTSFASFNSTAPRGNNFHNLEDQGIPRTLAGLIGYGVPVMQTLAHGRELASIGGTLQGLSQLVRGLLGLHPPRHNPPTSAEDLSGSRPEASEELTAMMMCVVAQGKDAAAGKFRLEGDQLRVERTDGLTFSQDPIYTTIRSRLSQLAGVLRPPDSQADFEAPFETGPLPPVAVTSHPLGGCPMGVDVTKGAVDEWGRVFRSDPGGASGVYPGLYIADASVIPTALGVNPSLTISAIALRIAEGVFRDMTQS